MKPPIRVLVLGGGPGAEAEVSRRSARAIAAALAAAPAGPRPVSATLVELVDGDPGTLDAVLAETRPDVVFPALHGSWGEGGPLQALLEARELPFVGAGSAAAALAMDKARTKAAVAALGVPTPESLVLEPGAACPLEAPLVLKPVDDGSSVDLRICRSRAEIDAARDLLHPRRGRLLAERFVAGRELTVGLLGGEPLAPIEIVPATAFYDYEAKYERNDTQYRVDPADLDPAVRAALADHARAAWRAVEARDLARADFLLEGDRCWFLEINTMPGFTDHSLLPMAARQAGLPMPALCGRLVAAAWARRPRIALAR